MFSISVYYIWKNVGELWQYSNEILSPKIIWHHFVIILQKTEKFLILLKKYLEVKFIIILITDPSSIEVPWQDGASTNASRQPVLLLPHPEEGLHHHRPPRHHRQRHCLLLVSLVLCRGVTYIRSDSNSSSLRAWRHFWTTLMKKWS